MASAYAALTSLMHIIEQLRYHPRPPISLDEEQVEYLTENIVYLQDFLEAYNSRRGREEVDCLRSRIADAAHAAEDIIESHIVDQILAQSTGIHDGENISSGDLCQDLQKVIEDLDFIMKEVMEIKDKTGDEQYFVHVDKWQDIKLMIENHPQPPVSFSKEQFESLIEKVSFLTNSFKCDIHSKEAEGLWSRTLDAMYAATNIIESDFMNQLVAQSITDDVGKTSHVDLHQDLQKVIEDMDFIKKEAMEIEDKTGIIQDQPQRMIETLRVSSAYPSIEHKTPVGIDDTLDEVMDKLIGQQSKRQIISIVGMGGIGKTTLARNAYINPLIVQHFDICAWVTISQEYNLHEILVEVLLSQSDQRNRESLSQLSEGELGVMLHKSLIGRRHLIILDDMWSIEAWDRLKFFFPDNNNGSRIVITTRLSKLASYFIGSCVFEMKFLDHDKSWSLLCKSVFGEENCPCELKHVGMKIARNCQGLPLSIVVVGGLLVKYKLAREYWEYIAENLNAVVNLEENEQCLKILHLSYDELPIHLKSCFLYMGTFPEDSRIRVSELIKLWVAEGFLKPIRAKSLEETAEENLMDLIHRNLILVSECAPCGKIKFCSIHDLVRDLCLREARKEKFYCVTSQHSHNMPHERRIALHQRKEYLHSLKFASVTRSLRWYGHADIPLVKLRLLRVLNMDSIVQVYHKAILQLVNSRYLAVNLNLRSSPIYSFKFHIFWNLQTLIVKRSFWRYDLQLEIWKMPLLRHVKFYFHIPNPLSGHIEKQDNFVLGNLQTLVKVQNFKLSEEVVKRIPNVKNLKIAYGGYDDGFEVGSHYCLYNLGHLKQLESLGCFFDTGNRPSRSDLLQNFTFPHSLKKLTLQGISLYWEDVSTKIGSLPLLQVLKLGRWSSVGLTWEIDEGQFPSLKYLMLEHCEDLEHWMTENTPFPCLEHLVLQNLYNLTEIPLDIGEIPTLQSIYLKNCSDSVIISAKNVLEQQENFGNEGVKVTVFLWEEDDEVQALASHNFQVTIYGHTSP